MGKTKEVGSTNILRLNDPDDQPSLLELEQAVHAREHEKASQLLLKGLACVQRLKPWKDMPEYNEDVNNRLTSAILSLFADPDFHLSPPGLATFMPFYGVIDGIFKTSSWRTPGFLFPILGEERAAEIKTFPFFPMEGEPEINLYEVFKKDPAMHYPVWLAMISHPQIYTKHAHKRREWLLGPEFVELFKDVVPRPVDYPTIGLAYMNCSYGIRPDKHLVKRLLHTQLSNALKMPKQYNWEAARKRRENGEKPLMIVPLEWWGGRHAMFRVYHKSISKLRERFHVIGWIDDEKIDDLGRTTFDEVREIKEQPINVDNLVAQFLELGPDVVYYPSIGMSTWVIAMASNRLAPLQCMSYGHPASSYSPVIDYGFIEKSVYDVKAQCSERIVMCDDHMLPMIPYEGKEYEVKHMPRKREGTQEEPVRIAVSAMHSKLSYPFIVCLREVLKRAKNMVHIDFFPYLGGPGVGLAMKNLRLELPETAFRVHPRLVYEEFLGRIAKNDICLFSFPFGGTNSLMDALQLQIPFVATTGNDLASRTEGVILNRVGLTDMIATSEVDYINRIVELVDNYDKRIEMHARIKATPLDPIYEGKPGVFGIPEAMSMVYDKEMANGRFEPGGLDRPTSEVQRADA